MDKSFIKDEARYYFVPLLLGNTQDSRRLARRIFKKYKIKSFILDEKKSFSDCFSLSHFFVSLYDTEAELTSIQLFNIANELSSYAPILIPCSEKYKEFVATHREALELDFIISSEKLLFTESPLKTIFE